MPPGPVDVLNLRAFFFTATLLTVYPRVIESIKMTMTCVKLVGVYWWYIIILLWYIIILVPQSKVV